MARVSSDRSSVRSATVVASSSRVSAGPVASARHCNSARRTNSRMNDAVTRSVVDVLDHQHRRRKPPARGCGLVEHLQGAAGQHDHRRVAQAADQVADGVGLTVPGTMQQHAPLAGVHLCSAAPRSSGAA